MASLSRTLSSDSFATFARLVGLVSALAAFVAVAAPGETPRRLAWVLGLLGIAAVMLIISWKKVRGGIAAWGERHDWNRTFTYLSRRYTWGIEHVGVTTVVQPDGSATITRKPTIISRGLIQEIEQTLHFPEQDLRPGWSTPQELSSHVEFKGGEAARCNPSEIESSDGRWLIKVHFTPALADGKTASFELAEQLWPALYGVDLTPSELAQRTPDYIAWVIDRPMLKLVLDVYFPGNYNATSPDFQVFFAPVLRKAKWRAHDAERKRLADVRAFRNEHNGPIQHLQLTVDSPIPGLIYRLEWGTLRSH